jgi:hypothetical protein
VWYDPELKRKGKGNAFSINRFVAISCDGVRDMGFGKAGPYLSRIVDPFVTKKDAPAPNFSFQVE